ncbi:hypothetical protein CEP53_011511 [Fusarium sp. AF-6]|nr:hypothetical protein CEP53_011511 [Fusarium sp. AF-6]
MPAAPGRPSKACGTCKKQKGNLRFAALVSGHGVDDAPGSTTDASTTPRIMTKLFETNENPGL